MLTKFSRYITSKLYNFISFEVSNFWTKAYLALPNHKPYNLIQSLAQLKYVNSFIVRSGHYCLLSESKNKPCRYLNLIQNLIHCARIG